MINEDARTYLEPISECLLEVSDFALPLLDILLLRLEVLLRYQCGSSIQP